MITLDQIEQLMARTGADYPTVRDALRATDGDMFKALLLIEQDQAKDETTEAAGYRYEDTRKEKTAETHTADDAKDTEHTAKEATTAGQILETLRELLSRFNATKITIRKGDRVILDLSATIGAIGLIIAPIAAIIGLGAAVVTEYEIILTLDNGREINVNQAAKEQFGNVKAGFDTYTERTKTQWKNQRKDKKVAEEEGYRATYETEADEADDTETQDEGAEPYDAAGEEVKNNEGDDAE